MYRNDPSTASTVYRYACLHSYTDKMPAPDQQRCCCAVLLRWPHLVHWHVGHTALDVHSNACLHSH
jgi:hypothetical protein